MPASFVPSAQELWRFAPEILLTFAGTLIMLLEPMTAPGNKGRFAWLALLSLLCAAGLTAASLGDPGPAFSGMLLIDEFGGFFRLLVLGVGVLTILISTHYLRSIGHESGEYYALLIFSIVGQCLMATANELIMLFIGLEVSSISSYVLAGYLRDDKRNNESALKYFLLGSFATAFLLYGVAWIYGITGHTNLAEIRGVLLDPASRPNGVLAAAACAFLFVGLAFKVSAAPFQMWAPDVYQGAPAPVTAFFSAGPKAAAFAMFLRIVLTGFAPLKQEWTWLLWISALATMIIGNFAALRQSNVKRLLAYSSIAHAGYAMVALTAQSGAGAAAVMFYLVAYCFMNIGAFAIVTHVAREGERYVEINDLSGLGVRQPLMAGLLTVFLLSLTGIPLTAGFFGKFYIFKAAIDGNFVWLAILGLLNSAVAAYYYLRLIVVMYMQQAPEGEDEIPAPAAGVLVTAVGSAVATFVLGLFPSPVLDFAGKASRIFN